MTYRGTQKKMIVLKKTGSPYFEEAYFILREGGAAGVGDMAREAERIIANMSRAHAAGMRKAGPRKNVNPPEKRRYLKLILFLSGVVCGVGADLFFRIIAH